MPSLVPHRVRRYRRVLAGGLAAGVAAAALVASGGPPAAAVAPSSLPAGSCLPTGAGLTSPSGQYRLAVQADGNVVVYGNGGALWWTSSWGAPARLCLQTDGNLVAYAATGAAVLWSANTWGSSAQQLVLQDDGNLVLYAARGAVWNTAAPGSDRAAPGAGSDTELRPGWYLHSADWRFRLVMQADGNLVLYAPEGPLWWSNTYRPGSRAVVQRDGNVVVYSPAGRALWWSGTAGSGPGAVLTVQSDGNAVVYAGGVARWASGTWRVPAPPLGYRGPASHAVTVVAPFPTSTTATLSAWTRTPSGWVQTVGPTPAWVGGEGVGAGSESSTRTPAGTFTLTQAFGRQPDPGTALPWFTTDPLDWWDENPASPTYNLHVRQVASPGGASENLYWTGAAYDDVVVIDDNTARVPGAGSGIFLHVSTGGPTAGCVAVPQATVVALLRWLTPGGDSVISIGVG